MVLWGGVVGGVRSVTVGVQFQRHPSRQAKGGGKPESVSREQAENKQKRILISTPTLYYVHYVKLFCCYPQA